MGAPTRSAARRVGNGPIACITTPAGSGDAVCTTLARDIAMAGATAAPEAGRATAGPTAVTAGMRLAVAVAGEALTGICTPQAPGSTAGTTPDCLCLAASASPGSTARLDCGIGIGAGAAAITANVGVITVAVGSGAAGAAGRTLAGVRTPADACLTTSAGPAARLGGAVSTAVTACSVGLGSAGPTPQHRTPSAVAASSTALAEADGTPVM
eukprot:scaffold69234_cov30-Tisochrysis_lutea.AAC.4